jgi:FkbM family methyltransferase
MSNRSIDSARIYLKAHPRLHNSIKPAIKIARRFFLSREQQLSEAYRYLFDSVEGGTLKVRVPDIGLFEIDGRSHILGGLIIDRGYETRLLELLRKHVDPNKDAIDVGANIGIISVFIAKLLADGSRVLSVEPTPGALAHLMRNIEANGIAEKVIVFQGVAEERSGEFVLKIFPGREEYSTLVGVALPAIKKEEYQELRVNGETIDELVLRHSLRPGLIKIDVEGAEVHVLRGAGETIQRYRPVILSEFFPDDLCIEAGGMPGSIPGLLKEYGYVTSVFEAAQLLALPQETVQGPSGFR